MTDKTYLTIPYMAGTDGDILFAFINATFQAKTGSVKGYPGPDYGEWLIEEIYRHLLLAEKQGLFKKRWLCPSCHADLGSVSPALKQVEYEFKYKNFPAFLVRMTVPFVECPQCMDSCGIDLQGSLSFHLQEAILRAFESENIKP
jgi:hypothetical protein